MEVADALYGVTMGPDGTSMVERQRSWVITATLEIKALDKAVKKANTDYLRTP